MEAMKSELMKRIEEDPAARAQFKKALHSSPEEREGMFITVDGERYTLSLEPAHRKKPTPPPTVQFRPSNKYRVRQHGSQFYPQKRVLLFFWTSIYSIGVTSLEEATEIIHRHVEAERGDYTKTAIHPYRPKVK